MQEDRPTPTWEKWFWYLVFLSPFVGIFWIYAVFMMNAR